MAVERAESVLLLTAFETPHVKGYVDAFDRAGPEGIMMDARMRRATAVLVACLLFVSCGGEGDDDAATAGPADAGSTSTASPSSGLGDPESGPEQIVMPDLVGQTEDEARAELGDRGIDDADILVDERESLEKAGTIIDQVPSSGQRVSGSVNLIVAKPVGPVPDFVGQELSDVEGWAGERAIEVRVEEVLDDSKADGEVLGTTPAATEGATSEILVRVARTPVIAQLSEVAPVDDNCSLYNGEIAINGSTYPNSVHSGSNECMIEYDLGRDWQRLKATAGLSDDSESGIQYRFEVFGDGTSLFNQVVELGATSEVDVDVSGVLRLRLQMTEIGSGDATAVWGDIRVIGSPDSVDEDEDTTTTTAP